MNKVIRHIIFPSWLLMLSHTCIQAQKDFQTIVTEGPVVAGESFQVQYVLEETDKDNEFFAPDFKGFRFVSGPNIYTGSAYGTGGQRKLKNIVYTLAATRPGKFIIPGASARIENRLIKSGNVLLEVISKTEAYNRKKKPDNQETNEDNFLSPGEDAYAKIRRNLFMKVLVDKKSCFVGEPVTAIFKLYSRLDSKSDIVKNPGFYGFSVQDMINLENRITSNETINGKEFDVHIVRKVQLYPLQAGLFSIDAMEVRNKVRFSKSAVNKKAEQEIVEGVFPDSDAHFDENTIVFENSMDTEPVPITVKPTPQKNKPVEYNGATGNFKLLASLKKNELAKNEEADLVISISGKGNFTQLSAPAIQWPVGLEGFEPTITDSLDHSQSPMTGKRDFHFRFISAKPGNYDLPTVSFSFFNPDTNNYKTVSSGAVNIKVTALEKIAEKVEAKDNKTNEHKRHLGWWVAGGLALITIFLFIWKGRRNKKLTDLTTITENSNRSTVTEILQPATIFSEADDKTFYNILRNCIWNFFTMHFDLTGSKMNKSFLAIAMQEKKIDEKSKKEVLEILDQCETGIFTTVEDAENDKKKLLEETNDVLEKINNQLYTPGLTI